MHVLTSIYETLDSFVVINQRLSYFIVNDITTSPSNRIRSCDQPILYAKHLSKYLHGNPAYSFLDTDVIPENIVILIKQCCDGWSCNKYVDLNVLVSVDGKPEKFIITECKTCSK